MRVKNPNWLEANQLAIYKRGRGGFELGNTVNKSTAGFELGAPNCKSSALTAYIFSSYFM